MKKYEKHYQVISCKRSATYQTWTNMRQRCSNPKRPDYKYYGGRGIKVCERWNNSFLAFIKDMGERPEGMSLDRKDNSLGYEPDNCKWATKDEQMQNTRQTNKISFNGVVMGLNAWAKKIGINKESLRTRLCNGWSIEEALTIPKRIKRSKNNG